MIYSICDFYVSYEPRYPHLRSRSEKYLAKNQNRIPDFSISVSEEEIDAVINDYAGNRALAEYSLAGVKFYEEIILRGAFFFHASSICVDGYGFAFSAPSGTGKSTHTALWHKYFGRKVISVNDDKPAVKIENDTVFICGTPFSGKNDISTNIKVPLCGICILERAKENSIVRLKPAEALPFIMTQLYRPSDPLKMAEMISMLDETLVRVPVYKLSCNISFEAVELAYKTMTGRE
ncbi:MAG: hypothetical protein ACI4GZ_05380 [Ruminococcus sp.]